MFVAKTLDAADVLLIIDVFEHVPNYVGFVSKCRSLATFKVYHIPLDIHVSSVVRNTFDATRRQLGHIHVFTASSAIATLRDTGHEIIDQSYTDGVLALFRQHLSIKRAMANIPRWLVSKSAYRSQPDC
jgi:hypothetical protein